MQSAIGRKRLIVNEGDMIYVHFHYTHKLALAFGMFKSHYLFKLNLRYGTIFFHITGVKCLSVF